MAFNVTLTSNVRIGGSDTNTNAHFITKLAKTLKLHSSQWEVGLLDIQYPASWRNVEDGYVVVTNTKDGVKRKCEIRSGRYASMGELLSEINRILINYDLEKVVSFYYDSLRNETFLMLREQEHSVMMSRDVAWVLGFEPDVEYAAEINRSQNPPDINAGFTSLYVYSSVVSPRHVGDSLVPLLRTVPITESERNSTVFFEFSNVQYSPVSNTSTDLIEVDIRRDDGERVSFRSGKVVLTVRFRPRGEK